jgi:hypothetical protein
MEVPTEFESCFPNPDEGAAFREAEADIYNSLVDINLKEDEAYSYAFADVPIPAEEACHKAEINAPLVVPDSDEEQAFLQAHIDVSPYVLDLRVEMEEDEAYYHAFMDIPIPAEEEACRRAEVDMLMPVPNSEEEQAFREAEIEALCKPLGGRYHAHFNSSTFRLAILNDKSAYQRNYLPMDQKGVMVDSSTKLEIILTVSS